MLYDLRKVAFILFIITCLSKITFGQTLKYKEVKDENLTLILNNLELISKYQNPSSDLLVNIYYVTYTDASRKTESCDAATDVYIAVSEDGEAPEQHLYKLSKLYDTKFIKWIPGANGVSFTMSYRDVRSKQRSQE